MQSSEKMWSLATVLFFSAITQAVAVTTTLGHESVDEHIEDALHEQGAEVKPVAELPNGDWLHGMDEELTPEQQADLFGHGKNKRLTIRAAAVRQGTWPDGVVPYTFRNFGRTKLVISAMRELQKGTCIQFKKREEQKNYIVFVNGDGCHSKLGMWSAGRQKLSLSSRGCMFRDTILHEMLHALGIIHEQERPDRDKHIEVQWENMKPGASSAFDLTPADTIKYYGVPYDFASIMHYSLRSWSKDRKNLFSMIPLKKKQAVQYVERKRNYGLSFDDYKILNRMYDCGAKCSIECSEPGFITKECECMTKTKFYEQNCQGDEESGWCLKFKFEGDIDDHLEPDSEISTDKEDKVTTEEPVDPSCSDLYTGCKSFAKKGYCEKSHANYEFVLTRCQRSCKFC